jgi:hypothetical protein
MGTGIPPGTNRPSLEFSRTPVEQFRVLLGIHRVTEVGQRASQLCLQFVHHKGLPSFASRPPQVEFSVLTLPSDLLLELTLLSVIASMDCLEKGHLGLEIDQHERVVGGVEQRRAGDRVVLS